MMNEGIKTLVFSLLAVVVVVVAFATRPRPSTPPLGEHGPLFPEFKDPADARELKISRFDETQGEFKEFEIAQKNGRWVIPSHFDYPADAEAQLKEAALCLIDLNIVDTISDAVDDHKLYGLVEPNPEKLRAGDQGVGVLVSMKGTEGKNLAKLIISDKKVEGHTDKRFVRKPGEDRVYVVKIDPSKLSTKFSDWIEKDLLKLNAFDVEQLLLKDYSVAMVMTDAGPSVRHTQRFELSASQEATGPAWKLDKLVNFQGRTPVPTVLGEDEELNSQKLDDIKTALDNLEIVDVRKKPQGLGANLRASEGLLKDREGIQSLVSLGFLPLRLGAQGEADIYAANGEVVVNLKDGAQYVLRFGNVAGAEEGGQKLNRYVLVTAQVNEAKFPPPVLEPLPEDPADEPAAPKEEGEKKDEAKEEGEDKKEGDQKEGDDKADEAKQKDDAKKAADKKKAELKAARDRIDKENKRKEDDYKANRKKAEDKVKELNARFADWYYVISEDVYKKVHLSRVDLIKEKTVVKEEGFGIDAFRKLEEGGLKKEEKKSGFDPPGGLPPGLGGPPPGSGE